MTACQSILSTLYKTNKYYLYSQTKNLNNYYQLNYLKKKKSILTYSFVRSIYLLSFIFQWFWGPKCNFFSNHYSQKSFSVKSLYACTARAGICHRRHRHACVIFFGQGYIFIFNAIFVANLSFFA